MFDPQVISKAIGLAQFEAVNASSLPKAETMTLLHIWAQSSGKKLRDLAQADELLPVLKKQYRTALEEASAARLSQAHLTPTECLQAAGLPLTL